MKKTLADCTLRELHEICFNHTYCDGCPCDMVGGFCIARHLNSDEYLKKAEQIEVETVSPFTEAYKQQLDREKRK